MHFKITLCNSNEMTYLYILNVLILILKNSILILNLKSFCSNVRKYSNCLKIFIFFTSGRKKQIATYSGTVEVETALVDVWIFKPFRNMNRKMEHEIQLTIKPAACFLYWNLGIIFKMCIFNHNWYTVYNDSVIMT